MSQGSIRLGRILGIPLSTNLGVLLIGGLLTWSLATVILPDGAPGLVGSVYWSVGLIGALFFMGSLLCHELAHAVVARRNGVQVEGMTLWLMGGFTQFENEPATPGAEFRISAAGPLANLVLGGLGAGLAVGMSAAGVPGVYVTLFAWLAIINGVIGVLNLLPGAPLDGGRILAAAIWKVRGDRATGRIGAANAGKVVGSIFIALGVLEMFVIQGFSGIWTILIGWFLLNAARVEHAQFVGERAMGDLLVADAMAPLPPVTRTWSTVAELVDGPLRNTQHSAVAVTDWQGRAVGIVTMADIRRLPAERWSATTVAEIVGDASALSVVTPTERLAQAIARLDPRAGGYAVVVSEGALLGIIGPDEVRRAIEIGRLGGRSRRAARGAGASGPPPPPVAPPLQHWEPPVSAI